MEYIKRNAFLSLILLLLSGILLTTLAAHKSQQTRAHASASSSLSLSPSSSFFNPIQKNTGETVSLDIMLEPGNNHASIVKLNIQYRSGFFKGKGAGTLQLNSQAFPVIVEGPVIDEDFGRILVTLSVGADPARAIRARTKIGTINLVATRPSGLLYEMVSFDTETQVYSVAPADHAYENVLTTAIPAYIKILDNGNPVPTLSPTPPLPTGNVTPTVTTMPNPSPTPQANDIVLSAIASLHGIGASGDSANPTDSAFSNKQPIHTQREFEINLYNANNQLVLSKKSNLGYVSGQGFYIGTFNLGTSIAPGSYKTKIVTNSYLYKLIPGIIQINPASKISLPPIALITGDINRDNLINVIDYSLLIGCYSDIQPPVSCSAPTDTLSDLNDDSNVNQIDYNLFIREISVQRGD